MLKKIKIILLSRLKKSKEDKEVLRKRSICKGCEFNSLNMEKLPFKKSIIKKLSDFYSFIAGKSEEDNLGNCTACESCSIYFKILMSDEGEDCIKGYWKISEKK